MSDPAAAVTVGQPPSDAEKAANPLFGKAPSAEKLAKMQAKEAKKKAAKAAAGPAPAAAGAADGSAAASSAPSAATIRALEYQPKVPKGTRDSTPEQMAIREKVRSRIRRLETGCAPALLARGRMLAHAQRVVCALGCSFVDRRSASSRVCSFATAPSVSTRPCSS